MHKKFTLSFFLLLTGCAAPLAIGGLSNVGMSAVEDRGLRGVVSDKILRVKVDDELAYMNTDFSEIDITVYKGRVLLTGVVANEKIKEDALRITKNISGIRDVIDGIKISGEDSFSDYTRDGWMTTKLKATLFTDEDVFAPNYLVTTFDKIIYIFGTAATREEMQRVIDYAYDITGVKRVVNLIEVGSPSQS